MAWRQSPGGSEQHLIPDCGDTDPSAAPSALSMPPISHWTTVGFCNGCPGGAERSMSQGLRVLVLLHPLRVREGESILASPALSSDWQRRTNVWRRVTSPPTVTGD